MPNGQYDATVCYRYDAMMKEIQAVTQPQVLFALLAAFIFVYGALNYVTLFN
jgi:hypothetical protein